MTTSPFRSQDELSAIKAWTLQVTSSFAATSLVIYG